MDQFDQAQELDAHYRQQALEANRRNRPQGESRTRCLGCDEKIPELRRRAVPGCTHCRDCAAVIEGMGRK